MDPKSQLNLREGEVLSDVPSYCKLIGILLYLVVSRPGISFAIQKLKQFVSHHFLLCKQHTDCFKPICLQPHLPHLQAAHKLLRYLKATLGQGIFFSSSSSLQLNAFCDADQGSCACSRKYISGYCIFLGDFMISQRAKMQATVCRSSSEVEYCALALTVLKIK